VNYDQQHKLKDLHPKVAALCSTFIEKCGEEGIDVLITSTYRDAESQNALYAQGRTTPGKKVTNAKAGQSWHNWYCAFDFVPIVNGKAQWNDLVTFERCGKITESVGFEWGWPLEDVQGVGPLPVYRRTDLGRFPSWQDLGERSVSETTFP
jgi:peptidoglycan L-alanyl-D-glutamate endopeptidase CwlK